MELLSTLIEGLSVAQLNPTEDHRGFFVRSYCQKIVGQNGFYKPITQINHTLTLKKGTVRGLHFQLPPATETKFVRCIRGAVWDVAVDLRKDSPTFLQWHAVELSSDNYKMFCIPDGFAHGFQTLADNCELLYLHTDFYQPNYECGFNALDKSLSISWPEKITEMSDKDKALPSIQNTYDGIQL